MKQHMLPQEFASKLLEFARCERAHAVDPRAGTACERLAAELAFAYEQALRAAKARPHNLPPVEGDLLPPLDSPVRIHLASSDRWVERRVAGYYVWPAIGESGPRINVQVVDANGVLNARGLGEVQWTPQTTQEYASDVTSIQAAYEHADARMLEIVRDEAVGLNEGRYSLTNEQQDEVPTLDQASPDLREAVEWLVARGMADLERDGCGVIVRVPDLVIDPTPRPHEQF